MTLIERDSSLDALNTAFNKAVHGEGSCIFVIGEAGIGKTALVKAFLKSVENRSLQLTGACDSLFTPRPLAPLYDLAGQLPGDLTNELRSIGNRSELFSSFREILTDQRKTVIIVFEDIHWADEATLDFVKFFARRIAGSNCLFILTWRDDEVNDGHPLRRLAAELPADCFTRLVLSPLSNDAVMKLAKESPLDGHDVFAISGGIPFYVNEILASYSPGIPENIRDSILSVFARQDALTQAAWQFLSIIPEGLDINEFELIDQGVVPAIEESLQKNILTCRSNRVFFKHELYRRTIEASLSPVKRLQLNRQMLNRFINHFEATSQVERIIQYARTANDKPSVIKYAPIAALQAIKLAAHIQASVLYKTAIGYADDLALDELVKLYEACAYECYLTNQISDAIAYTAKALELWKKQHNIERSGNSLRWLSRLWWFDGNGAKATAFASEAIDILKDQPASSAKAMALSNMSQLNMLADDVPGAVYWGNQAIAMARALNDPDTLSHALNNVGNAQWRDREQGDAARKMLFESLDIALQNGFQEHAARAYTNIISKSISTKDYKMATRYLDEGLRYCNDRDLYSWVRYKMAWQSRLLLETGQWDEADRVARLMIDNPQEAGINRVCALTVAGTIAARRGEDAAVFLREARDMAFRTGEYQRIAPLVTGALQYEWLSGERILSDDDLELTKELMQKVDVLIESSELTYWMKTARNQDVDLPFVFEPYQLLRDSRPLLAATAWSVMGCPFEQALALFEGPAHMKVRALGMMQDLGATCVYEKLKQSMRAAGVKKIPRGSRESTKSNPGQLTNRELEILKLLKDGFANKEIAGKLFISAKTVDHHISSILFKLDVKSRGKAVIEAARLGML